MEKDNVEIWTVRCIVEDLIQRGVPNIPFVVQLEYILKKDAYDTYSMHSVPHDVLILILSHADLKTANAVSLVCKAWNRAFKDPRFWRRHVERDLSQRCKKHKFPRKLLAFNTFEVDEPLMKQVSWLFKPDRLKHYRQHLWCGCEEWVLNKNNTDLRDSVLFAVCKHHTNYYSFYTRSTDDRLMLQRSITRSDYVKRVRGHVEDSDLTGEFVYSDGRTYVGNVIQTESDFAAEGEGKWTFPDGITHSGKHASLNGEAHGKGDEGHEFFHGLYVTPELREIISNKRIKL